MRTIEEVIAELRNDIHSDVYLGKKTINTYLDEILEIHKAESTQGDLISRTWLKEHKFTTQVCNGLEIENVDVVAVATIDNALTVEEVEKPFITECRNTAIEKNLPLYFVYYEETGVFEVYVTKTKELFEKRHCIKHLSDYEFEKLAMQYLDDYSHWKVGEDAKNYD